MALLTPIQSIAISINELNKIEIINKYLKMHTAMPVASIAKSTKLEPVIVLMRVERDSPSLNARGFTK